MGFTQGLLATLIADTAPPELRGTAYGVFNLLSGLAHWPRALSPERLGRFGPQATFLAGAGFTAVALIGLALVRIACQGWVLSKI